MSHIVESRPLTKLNGGLSWLHSADEDAVSWLTSYGSWHTYDKKKKNRVRVSQVVNSHHCSCLLKWTRPFCRITMLSDIVMPPPVWKEAVIIAFVHSSHTYYIANNSRTQRPSMPRFGRKVPHLRCDSQFQGQKVTRPFNADTSCTISSEWQGLRTSNLVNGWRTTTCISHRRRDLQGQRSRLQGHVISLEPCWPDCP